MTAFLVHNNKENLPWGKNKSMSQAAFENRANFVGRNEATKSGQATKCHSKWRRSNWVFCRSDALEKLKKSQLNSVINFYWWI